MKLKEKTDVNKNFTKLTHKRGISLIVLIVTIIVIIILAAAVILTITKNNPVSSAKEATFKEDVTAIQDELSMYLSKKYTDDPTSFDKSSVNLSGDAMVTELPSTKKYKDKVSVIKGKLVWAGKTEKSVSCCSLLSYHLLCSAWYFFYPVLSLLEFPVSLLIPPSSCQDRKMRL